MTLRTRVEELRDELRANAEYTRGTPQDWNEDYWADKIDRILSDTREEEELLRDAAERMDDALCEVVVAVTEFMKALNGDGDKKATLNAYTAALDEGEAAIAELRAALSPQPTKED